MANACDAVAAALRTELLAGRLSGRLPGMRELARRQGVSTFIVFQAIARLEAAGLVERRPRSCVHALTAVPLRVVIAEHQPWQLRFWRAIVAKAPGPIELVFQAHHAGLAQLLSDGVPSVVLSVAPGDLRGQMLADLRSLVPEDQLAAARTDHHLLAYQMQPSALVHRAASAPPARADWLTFIRWAARALGSNSLVPPPLVLPPLAVFTESVGCDTACVQAALDGKPAELRRALTALVGVLAACRAARLFGGAIHEPNDLSDALAEGRLGGAIRSSFLWPALGIGPGGIMAVAPIPGFCQAAVISAALAARKPCPAGLAFLRYLLSPVVQRQQMVAGCGLSPRQSVLAAAVAAPEGLPRGVPALAEHLLRQARAPDGASAALRDLQTAFAETIAVPLLAGDLSTPAAKARLGPLIGQLSARADDRHRTHLRHLLLSET